jgi:bifunctional DNase/RNase
VLHRVQITKVQDNTYFAELHLLRGEELFHIDARPSDSIAIALRFAAPIFAQESLLTAIEVEDAEVEGAGEGDDEEDTPMIPEDARDITAEQLKEYLEKMRPEDFGKFNL